MLAHIGVIVRWGVGGVGSNSAFYSAIHKAAGRRSAGGWNVPTAGTITVCHFMNITIRLLGGVSIFAKFYL